METLFIQVVEGIAICCAIVLGVLMATAVVSIFLD